VSLRARLLLSFAYVLVVVIVALEVPLALNLSRRVDAEIKSEAQGQAQLLAAGASGRLGERAQLDSLVQRSARDLGGRVIVVDRRGMLLADSAGMGADGDVSYASRPEIARALAGRPSQGTRHSESLGEDLLFTAAPVLVEGRRAGAVRVTQGVDAVQAEVRKDVIALIGVGLVALLLGLAVAWFLAGQAAAWSGGCGAAGVGRRSRRARQGRGLDRAARGGRGVQRDDRQTEQQLARTARVRRQRVAPVADSADRAAPAPRGGGTQEPRPAGRA
jgi:hypothetical protein